MMRLEVLMLLAEPKVRRWTKSEYYQAADLGWFEGQRVELIDGEVVEMAAQRDEHAYAVRLAAVAARKVFGADYTVLVRMPISLGPTSEPEPNVAVARGALRAVKAHSKTAVLIIEVSDTTLPHDRERKARLFAGRGIRDYWILNLVELQVEVRRQPVADGASPFGHGYTETTIYRSGQSIAPLAARKAKVADPLP